MHRNQSSRHPCRPSQRCHEAGPLHSGSVPVPPRSQADAKQTSSIPSPMGNAMRASSSGPTGPPLPVKCQGYSPATCGGNNQLHMHDVVLLLCFLSAQRLIQPVRSVLAWMTGKAH